MCRASDLDIVLRSLAPLRLCASKKVDVVDGSNRGRLVSIYCRQDGVSSNAFFSAEINDLEFYLASVGRCLTLLATRLLPPSLFAVVAFFVRSLATKVASSSLRLTVAAAVEAKR